MTIIATGEQDLTYEGTSYTVGYWAEGNCIYIPAILGKPPEDCHPDESECEILNVRALWASSAEGEDLTESLLLDALGPLLDLAEVETKLWAAYNGEDPDDEDYDDTDDYDHGDAA